MSAPATNDFSPAPVSTIARTSLVLLQLAHHALQLAIVWLLRALSTFGRLMVTTATAPSRSTRSVSKLINDELYPTLPRRPWRQTRRSRRPQGRAGRHGDWARTTGATRRSRRRPRRSTNATASVDRASRPSSARSASARIRSSVSPKYAASCSDTSGTFDGIGGSDTLEATKIPAM